MTLSADFGMRALSAIANPGAATELINAINNATLGEVPAYTGLTAHAGGGQTSGTALNEGQNEVTTVATIADSSKLPASGSGKVVFVANAASNSMNVFPQTGDQINAGGVNAAFAVAAGKNALFFSPKAGQWYAILSA